MKQAHCCLLYGTILYYRVIIIKHNAEQPLVAFPAAVAVGHLLTLPWRWVARGGGGVPAQGGLDKSLNLMFVQARDDTCTHVIVP